MSLKKMAALVVFCLSACMVFGRKKGESITLDIQAKVNRYIVGFLWAGQT